MWASTCVQLRIVIWILETTGATGGWFSGSVSLSSQSAPNGQPVGQTDWLTRLTHQISIDFQELRCKEFSSAPKAWCFDFSDGALAGRLRVLRCMCCNGLHRLPELWDEKKEKETNPSYLNLSIYPQTHFQYIIFIQRHMRRTEKIEKIGRERCENLSNFLSFQVLQPGEQLCQAQDGGCFLIQILGPILRDSSWFLCVLSCVTCG